MTLDVSNVNLNGNANIKSVTFSNNATLTFNTTTINNNSYWIQSRTSRKTIKSIAYGNGLYVAVGSVNSTSQTIETSPDGLIWTSRTVANTQIPSAVAYGNGVFVIGGAIGSIQSSSDGITWTNRTRANTNIINAITYGNGIFVAVGAGGSIVTSTDGTSWTNRTTANTGAMNAIVYGNGVFVAGGAAGGIQTSTDGITWTNQTRANTNIIYTLTYNNGTYVSAGSAGAITTSSDGTTWTNRTRANTNPVYCSTFFSNNFINFHAVSSPNLTSIAVTTSTDGVTWTNQNTAAYSLPYISTFSNTVAVGPEPLLVFGAGTILVDNSTPIANNGSFNYGLFLTSPSFPNNVNYTLNDNANNSSLTIKSTSNAVVLTSSHIKAPAVIINNQTSYDLDGAVNTQIFTANGFWIKPAFATTGNELVIVNLWGAGGGAIKSTELTTAAAGGGGAYVWGMFMASQCSNTANVVVGVGGPGFLGSGGAQSATDGGDSIFYHSTSSTAFLIAYGGRRGTINYTAPSAGSAYGGGGGGWLNRTPVFDTTNQQYYEFGGDPQGGNTTVPDSTYGGAKGSSAGISIYGGGGGGGIGAASFNVAGGNSFYGGGGGYGGRSLLLNAGNGGLSNTVAPGLAGGGTFDLTTIGSNPTAETGGRGEVRIYTIRVLS